MTYITLLGNKERKSVLIKTECVCIVGKLKPHKPQQPHVFLYTVSFGSILIISSGCGLPSGLPRLGFPTKILG